MIVYEVWNEVWEYRGSLYRDKGRAEKECQELNRHDKEQYGIDNKDWIVVETRVE